jgi:hypothetical protein
VGPRSGLDAVVKGKITNPWKMKVNHITLWNTAHLEKLIVAQLLNTFPIL